MCRSTLLIYKGGTCVSLQKGKPTGAPLHSRCSFLSAAREAQLTRANLLYRLAQYGGAAKAYESLLDGRDPGWDTLVNESLSYCYEGMGNFKKAAEVLKPVVEQSSGPLKSEVMRRLAMLYEQAQEPKEAAVYWRKLLDQPPDAALVPYLQEKLAAAEAGSKK